MIIHSSFKNYRLELCDDLLTLRNMMNKEDAFFVVDKKVYFLYKKVVFENIDDKHLYLVEAVEENKSINTVLEICEKMTRFPQKRNIHLISVGGGIIQDITGLVANILYRGIRWSFIPTTLLAACDSCIGGKTSLNYKSYKNLLGTFYPPDEIKICQLFFRSLSEKDYCSGLGEVVKFNVLRGKDSIKNIEQDMDLLLEKDDDILAKYLVSSLEFKKIYIEEDEFDKGIRVHLNYAHTFGHAIETVTQYAIPHGTAVAMGMVVANSISMKRGMLDEAIVSDVEKLVARIVDVSYSNYDMKIDKIISAIHKDKKQTGDNIRAILLNNDIKLEIIDDIKNNEIEYGFKYLASMMRRSECDDKL